MQGHLCSLHLRQPDQLEDARITLFDSLRFPQEKLHVAHLQLVLQLLPAALLDGLLQGKRAERCFGGGLRGAFSRLGYFLGFGGLRLHAIY